MAEPRDPREPRIPKETAPFDADNKWTRTWIMYFESLFTLSVKEAVRQTLEVAVTHTGDLTKDLPVFGNDKADIKVGTKSGNTTKLVTNTGTNVTGNTVKWDASGNLIDAGTTPGGGGGGTGTVTSVALTVPAEFSVAGSPVTTSGTLAVSKATQSANTVYAGPTTGSAAAPTFRAVDPADLPLASSSAFGAVKVDGTTITASSGVISAAAGGSAGALVLLESHTASSSASLVFTTRNATGQSGATFQSDYDDYQIEFVNLVPATNSVMGRIRMSTNGGSTYDSGSNYSCVVGQAYTGGMAITGASSDSATSIQCLDSISNSTNWGLCATFHFYSPASTTLYKMLVGHQMIFHGGVSKLLMCMSTGAYKVTTAVNALQFTFDSGNIASGIIRVYGIAK